MIEQFITEKAHQLAKGGSADAAMTSGYEQDLETEIITVLGSSTSRTAALEHLISSRISSIAMEAMPYPNGDALEKVVREMTALLCMAIADQEPGPALVNKAQTALTNLASEAISARATALGRPAQ
jgi:hypothetical protein